MDCINGQDCEFGNIEEFSQVDEALLMSLLDDSHVLEEESCDKEKLSSVMRSLEAEIDQRAGADQYTMSDDISPNSYWENDRDLIMEGSDETPGSFPVHVPEAELGGSWMDLEVNGGDYQCKDYDHTATITLDHYFDQYSFVNGGSFEDNFHDQLVEHNDFWQEP